MTMVPKKDARGCEIRVGTRVAYNYSGDVAIGVVEKITPKEFHIRRETHTGPFAYQRNSLSKVRNIRSMIAIHEVDDFEKQSRKLRDQALADFANANRDMLKEIANAWDLDEVHLLLEEKFGKGWKD